MRLLQRQNEPDCAVMEIQLIQKFFQYNHTVTQQFFEGHRKDGRLDVMKRAMRDMFLEEFKKAVLEYIYEEVNERFEIEWKELNEMFPEPKKLKTQEELMTEVMSLLETNQYPVCPNCFQNDKVEAIDYPVYECLRCNLHFTKSASEKALKEDKENQENGGGSNSET